MPIDPAALTQSADDPAAPPPDAAAARTQPAPMGGPLDGREGVLVQLKPRHLEWLQARAAAHGETVGLHAAGLLSTAWQTDEWRHANAPGMTRPGSARPKAAG